MNQYNLCFLGFGNVGRALARLLVSKSAELREQYEIDWRVTGVASRRIGWVANADGFEARTLLDDSFRDRAQASNSIGEWLQAARPDVVFETTSLNPESGQPAIDYLHAVL